MGVSYNKVYLASQDYFRNPKTGILVTTDEPRKGQQCEEKNISLQGKYINLTLELII